MNIKNIFEQHNSIFGSLKWSRFLNNQGQETFYLVSFSSSNRVHWIMPIVQMKQYPLLKLFPSIWVSYDGPFWSIQDYQEDYYNQNFLHNLPNILRKNGISILKFLQYNRVFSTQYKGNKIDIQEYLTSIIDLNSSLDDIWNNMEGRARTAIRKAKKNGVNSKLISFDETDSILPTVYKVYSNTYDRAEKKRASVNRKSQSYMGDLFKYFGSDAQLFISTYKDQISSMAILLKSQTRAMYFLGGSNIHLNRESNSSALLQWEIIKHIKEKGIKHYDLGGLPIEPSNNHPSYGIYKFKRQFGGKMIKYYPPYYKDHTFSAKVGSIIIDNALGIKRKLSI